MANYDQSISTMTSVTKN